MTTWAPTPLEATSLVSAWEAASDDSLVVGLIRNAVNEVVGEVGDFNPDKVINSSAGAEDQVTLGDLARDTAAIRAAHSWASGVAPELNDPEFVRALYARYRDQLERLKRWSGTGGAAFTLDMLGTASAHLPWCSLYFGASWCSCGVDIAGYPIYELD